jgi:hypothetical protein
MTSVISSYNRNFTGRNDANVRFPPQINTKGAMLTCFPARNPFLRRISRSRGRYDHCWVCILPNSWKRS